MFLKFLAYHHLYSFFILGSRSERLKQYEEHFQTAPECVLKFLKITKTEAEEKRESSEKEEKVSDEGEEGGGGGEGENVERKMSRGGIVLSSREKPLEELPNLAARARAKVSFTTILKESEPFPNYQSWLNFSTKVPFKPKTPARTPRNAQRGKEKEGKKVHHHHHHHHYHHHHNHQPSPSSSSYSSSLPSSVFSESAASLSASI